MLMGTADAVTIEPPKTTVFIEDMTAKQLSGAVRPCERGGERHAPIARSHDRWDGHTGGRAAGAGEPR